MKTKTTLAEVTTYICEHCLREYANKDTADWCELTHRRQTCKHTNLVYSVDIEDNYGDPITYINANCKDCRMDEVLRWRITDYNLSQDTLKEIVKVLGERNDRT